MKQNNGYDKKNKNTVYNERKINIKFLEKSLIIL